MTLRTILVSSVALAAWLGACGGGSELDDYSEGVPGVVPSPVSSAGDAGARDGGGGRAGGGNRDGGAGGSGTDKGAIGDGCGDDDDCSDSSAVCQDNVSLLGLLTYDLKGGYCTVAGCQSDQQCPSGTGCFAITGNCLQKCEDNDECRGSEGYECGALDTTQTYCVPSQVLNDIGSVLDLAGGLFGGTGGGGAAAGLIGGLLGGGGTGGFIGGLLGGGGAGGPGGMGN